MNTYENFVVNQTRRQRTPRTLTEAFRGADYGTAIWRCEKPQSTRYDVMIEGVALMVACGLLGYFIAIIAGLSLIHI